MTAAAHWHVRTAGDPNGAWTRINVVIEHVGSGSKQELTLTDVHRYSLESWKRLLSGIPPNGDPMFRFNLDWEGDRRSEQLVTAVAWEIPHEWLAGPVQKALETLRQNGVPFAADGQQ